MNFWLFKSEPSDFSFDDLLKEPNQTTAWDGIRNYQARNFMRDEMSLKDQVLFYHSNTKIPGVIGIAEVTSAAYADASQFEPQSKYYDPKASEDNPRWLLVDIKAVRALPRLVSLAEIKAEASLANIRLVQRGNRLSIMPLSKEAFNTIVKLADT